MHSKLFHNPKCSKSKAALKLLSDAGAQFDTYLYLEEGLTLGMIEEICSTLGKQNPWEFMRHKEPAVNELRLSEASTRDQLITAIISRPILLERPIFLKGASAVIGRPPEKVLNLL